ncbi:ABC transporter ATP-binding protein [Trichloromonas sp.]|uniref:ABC transporter ATP-binding protein n=1 Tax=Trichloromonas sp. TaxID=3069249 RepID=UPI002A494F14|nr:ABC transporter ATP-binding protein [Trichloromonas sp.]
MSSVIKVENLGKRYILNHREKSRFPTLRDEIVQKAQGVGRRLLHPLRTSSVPLEGAAGMEEFWALKDVSFEVKQGDRVGIIGRNGAGKSTLLKILSRITEPTTGRVSIKGRVASLLEVGTGFHPELTGRENIYLNGAILGMGKFEIRRKFDEIVDFSEVEKFLDTPVKRYSSGMYVRLAFAVAAHLEPEILIIDEVLAVGDAQFQQKCLGKMEEVGKADRTVLFVSHNMAAIRALCTRVALFEKGQVIGQGDAEHFIRDYLAGADSTTALWTRDNSISRPDGICFTAARIETLDGDLCSSVSLTSSFRLIIKTCSTSDVIGAQIAVRVTNQEGVPVFTTTNCDQYGSLQTMRKGEHTFIVIMPGNLLTPGRYSLIIAAIIPGVKRFDVLEDNLSFCVEDYGAHTALMKDGRLGVVSPLLKWEWD